MLSVWALPLNICKADILELYKFQLGAEVMDGTYRYTNTNSQVYMNAGMNVADTFYFDTLIRGYTGDKLYTELQWEFGAAQRDIEIYMQGTRGQGINMLSNSLGIGVRFNIISKKKGYIY